MKTTKQTTLETTGEIQHHWVNFGVAQVDSNGNFDNRTIDEFVAVAHIVSLRAHVTPGEDEGCFVFLSDGRMLRIRKQSVDQVKAIVMKAYKIP
ncbi:MAG: hypothetical protein KC621_04455 [Myxococcales bacterium]|nr:hypothetical protein [Myxococcales bacterium]